MIPSDTIVKSLVETLMVFQNTFGVRCDAATSLSVENCLATVMTLSGLWHDDVCGT